MKYSNCFIKSLIVLLSIIWPYASLTAGSVNIPNDRHIGFSGIEYHVPRNTRMILYQYKARKNQTISEAGELESSTRDIVEERNAQRINGREIQSVDDNLVTDCGISIGNASRPDIFAPKEQVVIIEGDVVNLGDCN